VVGRFLTEDPSRNGGNWYAYCRDNPVNCIDIDGRRTGIGLDDITVNPSAGTAISWDNGHPVSTRIYAPANYQVLQQDLPGGGTACHFWSLVHFAEDKSGRNFTLRDWYEIRRNVLGAETKGNPVMDSDYTVYVPGRDVILGFAFREAGLKDVPHTGPVGPGAKGTLLEGSWTPTRNLAMILNDYTPPTYHHFESGNSDESLLADPWGYRLDKYAPFKAVYGVYW